MQLRDVRAPAVVGLCIAAGAWWWWNNRNDWAVQALADQEVCGGKTCSARLMTKKRTLFGWELEYRVVAQNNSRTWVRCTRSLWIVGEHRCSISRQDKKPVRGHLVD